ncbi:hypothetical protein ABPG74_016212 [Tetrahymena malaccensis]
MVQRLQIQFFTTIYQMLQTIQSMLLSVSFFTMIIVLLIIFFFFSQLANYIIVQMEYIQERNQILVMNAEKIIYADPYTLESKQDLTFSRLKGMSFIKESKYAVLQTYLFFIYVVDIVAGQQIFALDISPYNSSASNTIIMAKFFSLQNGQKFITVIDQQGAYIWSIDFKTLSFNFNGYLQEKRILLLKYLLLFYILCKEKNSDGTTRYKLADIHSFYDILFLAGTYYQISAFQIVDLNNKKFKLLLTQSLLNAVQNNVFQSLNYITLQNGPNSLFLGDTNQLYRIDLQINYNQSTNDFENFNFSNINNPIIVVFPGYSNIKWSFIRQSRQLYVPFYTNYYAQTATFIISIEDNKTYIRSTYTSGGFTKIFSFQLNSQQYFAVAKTNNIYVTQDSPSNQPIQIIPMNGYIKLRQNTFLSVKGCGNCFGFNIGQTALNLQFDRINYNVECYFGSNNSIWCLLGLPYKDNQELFLFYAIDIINNQYFKLSSSNQTDNQLLSSYALYSIIDQEIIGIDIIGSIYGWDASSFQFKYKLQISQFNCSNSIIGQLFQTQYYKFLIIVCGNYQTISYNFATGQSQYLITLTSSPYHINSFESQNIIGLGDQNSGDVYIWQLNSTNQQFQLFLHFQSPLYSDTSNNMQYLPQNQILFIQYYYSNLFLPIGQCLNNLTSCLNCKMNFYFNTTETADSNKSYGVGTVDNPFSSSYSIISAFLQGQQQIKLINGFQNLNAVVLFDSRNQMNYFNELFTLQIFKQTNLTIQSWTDNKQATINIGSQIQFSSINMLSLININLNFVNQSISNSQCGILFSNIQSGVIVDNIQISSSIGSSQCYSIKIDNSFVSLNNIKIENMDLSNNSELINIQNSKQIAFNNFTLDSCQLSQKFSILTQITDVKVIINTALIQNNICEVKSVNQLFAGELFEAGQYEVTNMSIISNDFCNLKIFSTVSTIEQQNYIFSFNKITLSNNYFYTTASYLFFDAIYSINPTPQHTLIMNELLFYNNTYLPSPLVQTEVNMGVTQFVLIEKIQNITLTQITMKNHQEISFCQISKSQIIQLNYINCINEKIFYSSLGQKQYAGCLFFNEVKQLTLFSLLSSYIKSINNSILFIQNQIYTNTLINLQKIQIFDCYFEQNQINSSANPILITSINYSDIVIDQSQFYQNQLNGLQGPQLQSTTAIQIQNPLGTIILLNTKFDNSKSNSIYNFMYLIALNVTLNLTNFQQSSFDLQDIQSKFIQLGGCLRAKTQNLNIQSSNFSQSTANKGSFIYVENLSNKTNIKLENSQFNEGYANDGGAIFIDSESSIFNLIIKKSNFSDIYILKSNSAQISIIQSQKTLEENQIIIQQGYYQNIIGPINSIFLNVINTNITIQSIENSGFSGNYPDYLNTIFKISDLQSVLFLQTDSSTIQLSNCYFKNLKVKNNAQIIPILINSTLSNIALQKVIVYDSSFSTNLINVLQGQLSIIDSQFTNLNQFYNKRVLQVNDQIDFQGNSLILMMSSSLIVKGQSTFSQVVCSQCFGSTLQLVSTQFIIQDAKFQDSKANNGGAISLYGLSSKLNIINNTQFIGNNAQLNGGALYIKALLKDVFNLTISDCTFTENEALMGNGGALFIRSESESSTKQIINLENTKLAKNQAVVGGCIDNQDINPRIDQECIIEENHAHLYGDDFNSYPNQLRLVLTPELSQYYNLSTNILHLQNIKSGSQIPNIIFQLRDGTIKPVFPQDANKINVYAQFSNKTQNISNYYIRGNTKAFVDLEQKQFLFQDLQLVGKPDSKAILEFKSDAIKILNDQTNEFESNYAYEVQVDFRSCKYGEVENSYNTFTECVVCDVDKYSLDNKQCYQCPSGAKCKNGIIFVNQGFWRKNESSPLVIECINNPKNCIGDTYGNKVCMEGYIGPLCEECDVKKYLKIQIQINQYQQIYGSYWGLSYSKVGSYQCGLCKDLGSYLWKAILTILWTLFSIQLAIRGDLEEQTIIAVQLALKRHSRADNRNLSDKEMKYQIKQAAFKKYHKRKSSLNEEKASVYIKVFTNYLQIIGSIVTFNIKLTTKRDHSRLFKKSLKDQGENNNQNINLDLESQQKQKLQYKNGSQVEENVPQTILTNQISQSPNQQELLPLDLGFEQKLFQDGKNDLNYQNHQQNQNQDNQEDLINFTEQSSNSSNY